MEAEAKIYNPEFIEFTNSLENLSANWVRLVADTQQIETINLFEKACALGFSKEQFFDEIKNNFDVTAQTIIFLWIDSYILYSFLISEPEVRAPLIPTQNENRLTDITDINVQVNKIIPISEPLHVDTEPVKKEKIQPVRVGRPKSPKPERPKPERPAPSTIKGLIKARLCEHYSEMDIEFAYRNIEKEWPTLSKRQKLSVIRELFRYESFRMRDRETGLKELEAKLKFVKSGLINGYLVIAGKSEVLKSYLQTNEIDEDAIEEIGNTRSQLGALFDERELALALRSSAGAINVELLKKIKNKLKKTVLGINKLIVGEKYVIDPEYSKASKYNGYAEDVFRFVSPDDPMLEDYADLRVRPTQVFFIGRGNRIFVIDYEAVCLESELIQRKKKEEEENKY